MAYDILGNYITDDSNETDTPVQNQKQQNQIDIAQSVQPNGPVAPPSTATPNAWDDNSPLPNMPQGPAAPNPATPPDATNFGVKDASTWEDKSGGPVAPPAKNSVAGSVPTTPDYNTYTAQNESGNNPNIGYHDLSKGSAYGTYGLTAAAYKDIQKFDPAFADKPITDLTPEEQTRANNDYKTILGKQLEAQGLDPSEANLRLAHFIGAKGAADYLKSGAVSPQAAAANGGVENVQKIAQARLAGTPGAASGATTTPTHVEQFVQATQKPKDLAALRNDEKAPIGIRQAAADQDLENLSFARDTQQAKQRLDKTMESGNWLGLAKELNKQSEEGSIFKAMFYQRAGLTDLAKQEQQKLGAGRTWQTVDLGNGKQAAVQVGADGAPIKGYTDNGPMTSDQLINAVGMTNTNKADYVGGSVINDQSGQIGRIVSRNGRTMIESGGKLYPPTAGWRNNTVGTDINNAYNKSYYSEQGREQGKASGEGLIPGATIPAPGAPSGIAGNGAGRAPQQTTGNGQVAPQQTTGNGQVAPQQTTGNGQVAPQQNGAYTGAITNPESAPTGVGSGTVAQQRQNNAVNEVERKDYIEKAAPEITTKADQGRQIAAVRRRQLDILAKNPELAGVLQGQGPASTEVGNIIRDVVSGKITSEDQEGLSKRIASLDLNDKQKAALYNLAAENMKILPLTLKSNAGPGSISEAEHKINREANVDATRVPIYTAFSMLNRDQFDKDLQAYRNDWAVATGQSTRRGESSNWAVEQRKLDTAYNNIYKARAEYIAKYGSTPAAVVDAFKYYPSPVYNPETKSFVYGGYSAQAARPSLDSFNR